MTNNENEQKENKRVVKYNVITEDDKRVFILENNTSFRIVEDLLQSDYLRTVVQTLLEKEGKHDSSLTSGTLVSNRRSLKSKLVREGITMDLVLNRFLEEEIPREQYLYLQQYVGTYVMEYQGAENLDLRIARAVNEEYFRQKGIKLANFNKNTRWRLEFVQDILFGYCTLGHEIRYAYTAVDSNGNRLVFGSTCIHDFFEIDEQLREKLLEYTNNIKAVTDEYYNDYHAYYEAHRNLDSFMRIYVNFIQKLTDNSYFDKADVGYINGFVDYGIPIPRQLSMKVGLKAHKFTSEMFKGIKGILNSSAITSLLNLLLAVSWGSHGFTARELDRKFPTNFLGDRLMPKEVETIIANLKDSIDWYKRSSNASDDEFVNKMSLALTEETFTNILVNLVSYKQLYKKLEESDKIGVASYSTLKWGKGTSLIVPAELYQDVLGVSDGKWSEVVAQFVNNKLEFKVDDSVFDTEKGAFLNILDSDAFYNRRLSSGDSYTERLNKFLMNNHDRINQYKLVKTIASSDYMSEHNHKAVKWVETILDANGLLEEFRGIKETTSKDELYYRDLLSKAEEREKEIKDKGYAFHFKVLSTVSDKGNPTDKQLKYIKSLEDAMNKGFKDNAKKEEEPKVSKSENSKNKANNDSKKPNKYEVLLKIALKEEDKVNQRNLGYAVNILKTVVKTGKVSEKQYKHIQRLADIFKQGY